MNQETLTGMVLSAMPIGEYDKRIVILTKERGRISAFAKGARRPHSALLACSQPFVFGQFSVYQGRDSYTVTSAEIKNYFEELRIDLEAVSYGFYFCEFAAYLTRENVDAIHILKLLYQSLRALVKKSIPNSLIRYIFELKILCYNGEAPQVFTCVNHIASRKSEEHPTSFAGFSSKKGGLLCLECKNMEIDLIPIDSSTIYTLQYIVSSNVEKLYTFVVTNEVLKQLEKVTKQYVKTYADLQFRSLEMLEMLDKNP